MNVIARYNLHEQLVRVFRGSFSVNDRVKRVQLLLCGAGVRRQITQSFRAFLETIEKHAFPSSVRCFFPPDTTAIYFTVETKRSKFQASESDLVSLCKCLTLVFIQ